MSNHYLSEVIETVIKNALAEDTGTGDVTTLALNAESYPAKGSFLIKETGIIAGLRVAERVFELTGEVTDFEILVKDGSKVIPGTIAAVVKGSAATLLTAERTALNFLQRMSGIATLTKLYSEKIKHTKAKLLDTRKTVPGLRQLDKIAVLTGGGTNHRLGLFDMFLIKDNHIQIAGSLTKAVEQCIAYREKCDAHWKIEVETTTIQQVEEALSLPVDVIMLDNFPLNEMLKAVVLTNGTKLLEASGGVTLDTIQQIAETGVDYISVGAITHSVKALDISLEIELI